MELSVNSTKIRIDFSFILILCLAVFSGYDNAILILIFSVLHEFGHLSALLLFGVHPYLIEFSFFGAGIKYESTLSLFKEAVVYLCGPAVNLLFYIFLKDDINLFLFILNILPVFPLDGGRIVSLIFPKAEKAITAVLLFISFAFSIHLIINSHSVSLFLVTCYLILFNLRYL